MTPTLTKAADRPNGPLATPLRLGRIVAAALVAGLLSACAFGGDDAVTFEDVEPAESIYARAEAEFAEGNYALAAQIFDELERLHPTSRLTKRAMLRATEASYREGDYDKAALSGRRFLEFYPSDESADYAQYLIALSFYDQITDVDRDQAVTRSALQSLRELTNRYPDSEFAREGQLKLDLTLDHLAGKEMMIGRFYLERNQYIGAINRFRTVLETYQTTSHTPEALHRLVEAYLALGVVTEAQTAAAVLGHNFPGSDWYLDSYALLTGRDLRPAVDEGSWISQAWGVMKDTVGDVDLF